jgi:hypothetical protein
MLSLFSVVQTGLKSNQIFEDVIKLASINRNLSLTNHEDQTDNQRKSAKIKPKGRRLGL